MNLNTAVLLSERFLSHTKDEGLFENLNNLLETGRQALSRQPSDDPLSRQDQSLLSGQARRILDILDNSVFEDPAMGVFPEFEQMGFSSILRGRSRKILETMSEQERLTATELEGGLADLDHDLLKANELSDQITTLMSVAEYFGVEKRDNFEADAIAIIQMSEDAEGSLHNVDNFIDWIETFQSIIATCEADEDFDHNVRMISGDDPLIVADMSVEGATRLQKFVSQAKRTDADILEIAAVRNRLEGIGVRSEILEKLDEERDHFKRFEGSMVQDFLGTVLGDDSKPAARDMAERIYALMANGVRLDSVILSPLPRETVSATEPEEVIATAYGLEASELEAPVDETIGTITMDEETTKTEDAATLDSADTAPFRPEEVGKENGEDEVSQHTLKDSAKGEEDLAAYQPQDKKTDSETGEVINEPGEEVSPTHGLEPENKSVNGSGLHPPEEKAKSGVKASPPKSKGFFSIWGAFSNRN